MLFPDMAELGIAVFADLPFGRGRLFRAVHGPLPDMAQCRRIVDFIEQV